MKEKIQARLRDIEAEEGVRIFYACESGSRAWGFPSADSDYDVRFLYLRPQQWYLSIDLEAKRDVIEPPLDDRLDISGWDLRKALKLFRKSNPPLLEWLGSPIIYLERFTVASRLRRLAPRYYSPEACFHHYFHMARRNYRDYLKGSEVWIKKYFYVLRPILALNWVEQDLGVVPTEFKVLVDRLVESPEIKAEIANLIVAKREGQELGRGPRLALLGDFIERELERLERKKEVFRKPKAPVQELNDLFRAALEEVWQHE